MKKIKIVSVQLSGAANKEINYKAILTLLKPIKANTVNLITLPEVFPCCASQKQELAAAEDYQNSPSVKFLQSLAKAKSSYISGGSILIKIKKSKKVYNRSVFVSPQGKIISHYDKIHLFDVNFGHGKKFMESSYIQNGKELIVTKTPLGNIGLSICYDLRFPELFRRLALKGAQIIILPSAFISKTGEDHFETLIRARAIENQVFIIATNQIGEHEGNKHTYGGSIIVDPWGNVLARAATHTPAKPYKGKGEIIRSDINLKLITDIRNKMPCLENARLL